MLQCGLKEITIPTGVSKISAAFFDCTSLQKIKVCSDSKLLDMQASVNGNAGNKIFWGCHPSLRMEVDSTLETYSAFMDRYRVARHRNSKDNVSVSDEHKREWINVPTNTVTIYHYKMVKGKRVLVGKETKPQKN